MKISKVLAKILEDDEPIIQAKEKPVLRLVPKVEHKTARVPFNEQRRQIRSLIETAWLKPYYACYQEIDARMPDPEKLPYEQWLKSLKGYNFDFWSDCIRDNLSMEDFPSGWSFTWGKAQFHLNNTELKTVFTFWKSLNKRI